MNKVRVSIVIPSFNGGALLDECLEAIFSQETELSFEVLVIDSGSTDGTVERLKRFSHPLRLVEIAPEKFNHGLTRNRGIELAKGEFVVLMTQDAVPADNRWLDALINPFYEDPRVAGVYARQLPRSGANVLTKRHLEAWLTGRTKRHVSYISSRDEYENMRPMEKYFLCNFDDVCSAIRKSVWEKIPYVKTDFGEDLVWSKKALLAGFKIVYEPGARVVHSHSRSLGYEYRRTRLCHRRLHEIFGVRTVPTWTRLVRYACKSMGRDVVYLLMEEPSAPGKIFLILRAPFASFLNLYAQYRGALDAVRGRSHRNIRGV
ncbi:MAG: glycosyltransferase family 2 protein [Thermodesulfobacteriota bacterium]